MTKSNKSRKVRIIGGKHKGVFLSVNDDLVKPTPDRIRETLFNWLSASIEGSRVLELFGGSGCLSLECVSRGSNSAFYIDSSNKACSAFKDSLVRYRINDVVVKCKDSIEMIQKSNTQKPFDVIFLDPPYGKYDLIQIIDTLYDNQWASGSSKIYLESNECLDKIISSKYQLIRDSKAGNVYYGILKLTSQNSLK
jgi:16S rRNA (guanine966-N2)-methyltransferase